MRYSWPVFAVFLLATAAVAATAEETYWAARDKAVAQIKQRQAANADDAQTQKIEEAALNDLQKRLVAIVGPVAVKGFPSQGKINLQTLGSEIGADMLDGLVFSTPSDINDSPSLVVSTRTLTQKWLSARAAEADANLRVPAGLEAALRDDSFYSFGIGSDAAFSQASGFDIAKPAGADFAFAALGRWSQDIGPSPLDQIVVAVVKGERVLVADVTTKTPVPEIPACKAIWDQAFAKADQLNKLYQASGQKNQKAFDDSEKASAQGDNDWIACVRQREKGEKVFPALLGEAQDLANRMAAP